MHKQGKTRSKTGCRTCRIRKVKCDEEKHPVEGQEPHCRRCTAAGIKCEWRGGPIPRKSSSTSSSLLATSRKVPARLSTRNAGQSDKAGAKRLPAQQFSSFCQAPLLPSHRIGDGNPNRSIQAANSLTLSAFDRDCLSYLQNSTLVIVLGKHWPWSTISYAYHRIAVNEPMVMSMILASTAREIHRSRLYDQEALSISSLNSGTTAHNESCELDGRTHYGRALSSLRQALKSGVKSPQKVEAIFITLWLMIDYENRFGSGAAAINIHIRGIESLLHNHVVPFLRGHAHQHHENAGPQQTSPPAITSNLENSPRPPVAVPISPATSDQAAEVGSSFLVPQSNSVDGLGRTSVPLFLLWTLYFFTPAALFFGPTTGRLDSDIFHFFLGGHTDEKIPLTLSELYRISRQSPARFWGETYPMSAQMDDMENLPALTLYHRSHVIQFKITEQFKLGTPTETTVDAISPYQKVIDEINIFALEYDTVLTAVRTSQSCDIGAGRRVLETSHWAAITFYSTIVFFHLCFQDIINKHPGTQVHSKLMPLSSAVSLVLELSLKLHRSRPHLIVRITWPLFLAGIATSDRIYQDWVSIRLKELGRFGQNYTRIGLRFDEIIQGGHPYVSEKDLRFLANAE
ncbi:C6 zinc finger domain protein [Penicillium brasilianum]|uniref:C6 zinc finger domain protein n=1 Tax=Penicillium brasilianum TaxID=104259 RepID=A0A1S9RIF8_PENBI|nr:C6 zinc finger domain protein [Penicillium brasilianum]